MSTTLDILDENLPWTCPAEHRPAARRALAAAGSFGPPVLSGSAPALRVTDELIRTHAQQAHALRQEAIRSFFRGLLGRERSGDRIEL